MSAKIGNLEVYKAFCQYDDPKDIDYVVMGAKFGVSANQMGGVASTMIKFGKAWRVLTEAGIPDYQIPPWIKRPSNVESPFSAKVVKAEEPEKKPRRRRKPSPEPETPEEPEEPEGPEEPEEEKTPEEGYGSQYYDPAAYAKQREQELAQEEKDKAREEELKAHELEKTRLMKEIESQRKQQEIKALEKELRGVKEGSKIPKVLHNQPLPKIEGDPRNLGEVYRQRPEANPGAMQLPNGTWVKPEVNETGETFYVPLPAPETEDDVLFSQIAYNTLRINTIAIAKKIGMNPSVLQAFSYSIARGFLSEGEDLGDFINKMVAYGMQSLFGVKFGVMKVADGAIDRFERAARYTQPIPQGGEYNVEE